MGVNHEINETIYSKNVIEFITVAREYCAFVEKVEKFERKDFIHKSQKFLSLIYLKACTLPSVEIDGEPTTEHFVTEGDWIYINEKISEKLDRFDTFLEISDPIMQRDDESTSVKLSEIYADIYQDLKNFMSLFREGNEDVMTEALWECKQNFETYWGHRLLSASLAIHGIIYGEEEIDDEKK